MQRTDTHPPTTMDPAPGLRFQHAVELFDWVPQLTEDMTARPVGGVHCLQFVRSLAASPTPEESATLLSYSLQPRHAVWWSHECLQSLPDLLTEADRRMLGLIAAWVAEPDEDHRYAALDAGMTEQVRTPGGWLALGAGWSGGSMSGPDMPAVPPPRYLMGRALNAGVHSALARVPQDRRRKMLDHYVGIGEVLAKSG
ncbi:MAG: DUF6931 family protein [Paracoccaceae bacterium]